MIRWPANADKRAALVAHCPSLQVLRTVPSNFRTIEQWAWISPIQSTLCDEITGVAINPASEHVKLLDLDYTPAGSCMRRRSRLESARTAWDKLDA